MVGSGDQSCILPCCNCGDFHDLWWVLVNSDVFCIVVIVVIFMICGGFW